MINPVYTATESYLVSKSLAKAERMKNAQVAQDFLSRDTKAIKEYLKEDLVKTFSEEDVAEFQLVYMNPVPKIINRISLLYKNPAKREIVGDKTGTDRLNSALTKTAYDRFMRELHKHAKLHNTVIAGIVPDGAGSLRHMILKPDIAEVEEHPDNYLAMKALRYPTMKEIQGEEQIVYEYWSEDEYKWTNDEGDQITTDGAPVKNAGHPGFMPFEVVRMEEQNDFWGDGKQDLIDGVRTNNFLLTSALVENIIMSAFGQLIGINLDLPTLKLGPKHPILVEDVGEDMARPGLDNVSGTPHTEEIRGTVDWLHKTQGVLNGMPASDFSEVQEIHSSGYAKMIDNLELLEEREADALIFLPFEVRYLEKFARVWNRTARGGEKLPESMDKLKVQFVPVKFPQTQQEKTEKWRFKIESGAYNQIDMILDDHPDWTRDEAKAHFIKVQKEARDLEIEIRGKAPNSQDIKD